MSPFVTINTVEETLDEAFNSGTLKRITDEMRNLDPAMFGAALAATRSPPPWGGF